MPILKKYPFSRKRFLITLILILLGMIIYLNRSYAHIFDYDKARMLVTMDLQRKYTLENGNGKETLKYVALGDSLTYGFGASNYKETFPFMIASKLLKNYKKVEVINLAVSGSVINGVLETQLPKVLEEKPGFVTLMIGTNDVHNYVDKEAFRTSLNYILDRLKNETKAQILLINIPYLGTKDLVLPPHNTIIDLRIREFNQVIAQVANEKQVKYFDLYSASNPYFEKNPERYYSIDKFHPSGEGYILWGNLINAN